MNKQQPLIFILGVAAGAGLMALFASRSASHQAGKPEHTPQAAGLAKLRYGAGPQPPEAAQGETPLRAATFRRFEADGPTVGDFKEVLFSLPCMQRRLAFSNLLAQLTADRLPEVLALIAQAAPVYDLHAEHEMLWERWGELDGPAACQAIFEKDARFEHTGISQKTIEAWSRQNPQAASAWLMAQQDIPLKASMMRGVLDGYAFCDPAGAHDFIRSELADAALKDHGYWRVARSQLVEKGLTGVQDYFARFDKSDANYKQLTFTVADIFTDAGSREALQWMAGLEAGNREQVSGYMLGRLINDRPDDLVRTLAGSEATGGMNRQEVISQAVAAWTKVNPDDMGLWLRDNRQAPHYDEIAAAYVNHIRSVDPAAAEAWSKTIKNPASSRE